MSESFVAKIYFFMISKSSQALPKLQYDSHQYQNIQKYPKIVGSNIATIWHSRKINLCLFDTHISSIMIN